MTDSKNYIETKEYNKIEDYTLLIDKLDINYTDYDIIKIIEIIPEGLTGLTRQITNLILERTKELKAPIGKVYLKKLFKLLQEQDNEIDISQIERNIAKQITDKYTIITFRETDEICLYQSGVFLRDKISKTKIRQEIFKIVNKEFNEYQETLSKRGMIIEDIKDITFFYIEDFYLKEEIINLKNGIILYKNDKLTFIPHHILEERKEILYTFVQFPIYFNKNARCPTIKKLLIDIFDKDQLIDVMEFVSYILVPTLRFDKALMMHGPTNTGETTFLNMLKQFLGRWNISQLELYKLAKQFQIENLRYKVANISDDLAPLPFRHSACAWIKKLITNNYLEGELKNVQGNKSWINNCKLVCACNVIPNPDDKTDAWWKRWIIISCVNQFIIGKNRNDKYKHMKWGKEEMSGFLNMCLVAWMRLNKRGGFRAKWYDPDYVKLGWMSNIDPVFEFVNKYCNIGNDSSLESIDYEAFITCFNTKRKDRGLKLLSKSLITRGLKHIDERIKPIKINKPSNPNSSGHKYVYIGWNGLLFVEGNDEQQKKYIGIANKYIVGDKKIVYKEPSEVDDEHIEFKDLDIEEDIEEYDGAIGKVVKANK